MGKGAAHAWAAEDYQAQRFVDDIWEHGAQCQKDQAYAAKKASGG